jgi:hypothetical protein
MIFNSTSSYHHRKKEESRDRQAQPTMNAARDYYFFRNSSNIISCISDQMIDDLRQQEGVHGICVLGACRDRAALVGFITTLNNAGTAKRRAGRTRPTPIVVCVVG